MFTAALEGGPTLMRTGFSWTISLADVLGIRSLCLCFVYSCCFMLQFYVFVCIVCLLSVHYCLLLCFWGFYPRHPLSRRSGRSGRRRTRIPRPQSTIWGHQKRGLVNLRFVIFLDFPYINTCLDSGLQVCMNIEGS